MRCLFQHHRLLNKWEDWCILTWRHVQEMTHINARIGVFLPSTWVPRYCVARSSMHPSGLINTLQKLTVRYITTKVGSYKRWLLSWTKSQSSSKPILGHTQNQLNPIYFIKREFYKHKFLIISRQFPNFLKAVCLSDSLINILYAFTQRFNKQSAFAYKIMNMTT